MDATASVKHEAQPASDGASTTASVSVPEVRREPMSELVAVAGGCGAAEVSGGVSSDDEQVERFYALLANIRALRNVYGAGGSSRKRARGSEPPWRPQFRMEDFREVDDAVSAKKERMDRVERHRSDSDDAGDQDGEVVEENDRVSASQSTRA